MPKAPVPERYRDILESRALGHLATIDPNGRPNVNPVWFLWDGEHVHLSIKPDTAKYRSLRADPNVALSVSDPSRPDRYVELRGTVVDFELFDNLSCGRTILPQVHRLRLHRRCRRRAPVQSHRPHRLLDSPELNPD